MMVLPFLLFLLFMLVLAVSVGCLVACCLPPGRSVAPPWPVARPGWPVRGCEQHLNRSPFGQQGYGVPVSTAVWPGMWVGPVIPSELQEPSGVRVEPGLCGGFLQQRRQLSRPARRAVAHEARR